MIKWIGCLLRGRPTRMIRYFSPTSELENNARILLELQSRYNFLKPKMRVLEIGSAPGGWSQVIVDKIGSTKENPSVVCIDLEDMKPVNGTKFIKGDVMDEQVHEKIQAAFNYNKIDLVLSDATWHNPTMIIHDFVETMNMAFSIINKCKHYLSYGGSMLVRIIDGPLIQEMMSVMKFKFKEASLIKPTQGIKTNESYIFAEGYECSPIFRSEEVQSNMKKIMGAKSEEEKAEVMEEIKLKNEKKILEMEKQFGFPDDPEELEKTLTENIRQEAISRWIGFDPDKVDAETIEKAYKEAKGYKEEYFRPTPVTITQEEYEENEEELKKYLNDVESHQSNMEERYNNRQERINQMEGAANQKPFLKKKKVDHSPPLKFIKDMDYFWNMTMREERARTKSERRVHKTKDRPRSERLINSPKEAEFWDDEE